jgi:ribonuclease HI
MHYHLKPTTPPRLDQYATEPKVLNWKWYLQEQFKNCRASAKGQTPAWIEDIADAPIIPCLITIGSPQKLWPIGSWGTALWSPTQIMLGSLMAHQLLKKASCNSNQQPGDPRTDISCRTKAPSKPTQHAEVHAASLAICHSLMEGHKIVWIYFDSWCLCNGIAIWSPKWQQSEWKINGETIWSREDWMDIAEVYKQVKIYVIHMDAHTSKLTLPMPIMTKLINWLH